MKKLAIILVLVVAAFGFAACGIQSDSGNSSSSGSSGPDPSVISAHWTLCNGHITPRIGFQGDINFVHNSGTYASGTVTYTGWFGGLWFSSGVVYVLNDYGIYSGTYNVNGNSIHLTITVPNKGTDSTDYLWGYSPSPPPVLLYMYNSSNIFEQLQCIK